MLDWSKISTVLLDMDGTILDLHFDNRFWLQHLPLRYSEKNNISLEQAKVQLLEKYHNVMGTIDWYCLDYWQEQTGMSIIEMKKEIQHLIQFREDARQFLLALKQSGREVVLVTNAHPDSLSLKIERTQLDQYFDKLYSSHEFGVSKESQLLWKNLQSVYGFNNDNTLFIDDSLSVLDSAKKYGINYLLAVANPDSQKSNNDIADYDSVTDFRTLIPDVIEKSYSL